MFISFPKIFSQKIRDLNWKQPLFFYGKENEFGCLPDDLLTNN